MATQAPDGGVNAHTPAGVRGSLKAGRHAGTKHVAETMLGAGSLPAWRAFPAAFPPVLRGATVHVATAMATGDLQVFGRAFHVFCVNCFLALRYPGFGSPMHAWLTPSQGARGCSFRTGVFPPRGSPEKIVNHASCCKEINILKFL